MLEMKAMQILPLVMLIALLWCFAASASAADRPTGTVTQYSFDQSRIFPGTVRDYWVYVPAQYDGSRPACVHVNQDGVQFNAPEVFDQLIAEGKMPVTIGIFVKPGVMPPAHEGGSRRGNRSYEYDSITDDYVRFLLEELLPHVEKTLNLNLSHDGNDRSIAGTSSGAICAFNAAWHRPDAFTRVFSGVGSYVNMRGGDAYPLLVRQTEPKPIRVFLQDGCNDLSRYCGDWWMANQTMLSALTFAGYEVNHVWDESSHGASGGTVVFADAMTWLWKDWPKPVQAGPGTPLLQEILIPGQSWQETTEPFPDTNPATDDLGGRYAAQPRDDNGNTPICYMIADGQTRVIDPQFGSAGGLTLSVDKSLLLVSDTRGNEVYSYRVLGPGQVDCKQKFYYLYPPGEAESAGGGGMCMDSKGYLYVATHLGVQVCDNSGRVNGIIATPGGDLRDVRFGGPDRDTLYAICGDKVYARKLKVSGAASAGAAAQPQP